MARQMLQIETNRKPLVAGDVEVLADEAHVAALGSLGAVGVAENPLVGLPVAVAVADRGHVGCGLGARAIGARRQRHHHLEAAVVDHAGRVVERGVEDFDDRTRRHAERLDARGVELAVLDLPAMCHEQDKVAGSQVKLAGAVILQAVELRVVAVAPAELEAASLTPSSSGALATYLLPSGMGVAASASTSGAVRLDGTSSHTRP